MTIGLSKKVLGILSFRSLYRKNVYNTYLLAINKVDLNNFSYFLNRIRMARYSLLAVLFLALAIAVPLTSAAPADICAEACWEKCFQVSRLTGQAGV